MTAMVRLTLSRIGQIGVGVPEPFLFIFQLVECPDYADPRQIFPQHHIKAIQLFLHGFKGRQNGMPQRPHKAQQDGDGDQQDQRQLPVL
jgi:hypothetical protein